MSRYNDAAVNELRKRLWRESFKYAEELRSRGDPLSGLELLMALEQMRVETIHHWVEDRQSWDDILTDRRLRQGGKT